MNIDKLSKIILWVLMGINFIVIILFFVIGYDTPWEEDPKQVAPQFTDVLLIWTIILTVVGAICMLVSFIYYVMGHGFNKSYIYTWGLPIISIAIGVAVGVSNKDEHMLINGKDWNVPSDIIITDASMISIAILSACAVLAIIYCMIKSAKK